MSRLRTTIKHMLGNSANEEEYLEAHGFRHGKNYNCYSPFAIDANWPWLISVGDNVTISSDVKILAHDASTNTIDCHTKIGIVEIGNNVFIGEGSIVLCNTRIGDNVVIGAGSVVTHDCPSNAVYAGNPARRICSIEEYREKHETALQTHHYFNEMQWDHWKNASPKDWEYMRELLKKDYGYI